MNFEENLSLMSQVELLCQPVDVRTAGPKLACQEHMRYYFVANDMEWLGVLAR